MKENDEKIEKEIENASKVYAKSESDFIKDPDGKKEREIEELKKLNINDVSIGSQVKEMTKLLKEDIEENNRIIEKASKEQAEYGAELLGKYKKDIIAGSIPSVSIPIFEHMFKLIIKDNNDNVVISNYYVREVEFKSDKEIVVDFLFTEEFGKKLLNMVTDKKMKFWIDIIFISASMDETFEYKRNQLFKVKKVTLPNLRRSSGMMSNSKNGTLNLKVTFKKPFWERFI